MDGNLTTGLIILAVTGVVVYLSTLLNKKVRAMKEKFAAERENG